MTITGIEYVHVPAPAGSEDRARAFYGDLLGLAEHDAPPEFKDRGGVWFECGGSYLFVGPDAAVGSSDGRARPLLSLRVRDLRTLRDRLEVEGHHVGTSSGDRFACEDRLGNVLEFVEAGDQAVRGAWLATPELLEEYRAGDGDVDRVAVSADGRWLAAATSGESGQASPSGLGLWRLGQPGEPEVLIEMAAPVWELAFSPDGRELAALSDDGSLETWRPDEFEADQFAEHPERSAGLAYTADGSLLAAGSGERVEVYRASLDHVHTIRPGLGPIQALAFDSHNLLAVSGRAERIQLWQVRPAQLSSWELLGHETHAVEMQFNPAGPVLAAITDDGSVLWWDVNAGPEAPQRLEGEMVDVNALAFSPDGDALACGDEDGRVWLWDWRSGQVASSWDTHAPVLALAFTPDGGRLIVGHEAGYVRVWKVR
jgi:WD40 repeat protein